ncbi:MAG: hypothetical protein NTW54_00760 [Bacteroidetes bacterium]|nr:hypothetical protein [Bacteroidota bacterium]
MKHVIVLFSLFILTTSFHATKVHNTSRTGYDGNFVEISSVKYKDEQFNVIYMKREGNRVKAKYFAAADFNGNNVYKRYQKWVPGKNVILVSSGTYMDYDGIPVGLTIDNGVVVNKTLANNFDGLVIVNVNGGITVTNLKDGDLQLKGTDVDTTRKYDLRKSAWDMQAFIKWAVSHEATVFQSHLLVYNNKFEIAFKNSSNAIAPRRFLAIGKDEKGKIVHAIIQSTEYATLYNGSKKSLDFLNQFKDMEVNFMINLDTGDQDVFKLYDRDGTYNRMIKGEKDLSVAVNLLTYYFQ